MKKIIVSDTTLIENETSLSFKEKIEIIRHLDNLNTDVINIPEIKNGKADALLIKTAGAFVKHSILSVGVGMTEEQVQLAADALANTANKKLRVEFPVSTVQMEYLCHKKPPVMLELAKKLFAAATKVCDDVEFVAVDATRAEREFLSDIISAAITAGVKTITLCDNGAVMLPDELGKFICDIKEQISEIENVNVGISCYNSFGTAIASAAAAINSGINTVRCAVNCANIVDYNGFASLIREYGDRLGVFTDIKYTELNRTTKQIGWIIGKTHPEEKTVAASEESTAAYDKDDDFEAISAAVRALGYDLSSDDEHRVYEEFKRTAAKKQVGNKELDAIVASVAMQVPSTYKLVSYVINNGNIIAPSAHIKMEKDGEYIEAISLGDGPVDASFHTIEQIIGHKYELDDFQIQAVTEGCDSLGAAVVKLRYNGKLYSGNGLSTDIIGASIRAYINAVNKIVYEEAEQ